MDGHGSGVHTENPAAILGHAYPGILDLAFTRRAAQLVDDLVDLPEPGGADGVAFCG